MKLSLAAKFMGRIDQAERKKFIPRSMIWLALFIYRHCVMHREYRSVFDGLGPGKVFVDCGANIGLITKMAAWDGATVYAYEPDPSAFSFLQRYCGRMPNVNLVNKAVLDKDSTMPLFRHKDFSQDRGFNQSSSLLAGKQNVDAENQIIVDVVDIARILSAIDGEIAVLKIDVEGAEFDILDRIIDSSLHKKVRKIWVETHEDSIPGHDKRLADLQRRLLAQNVRNIDLAWH